LIRREAIRLDLAQRRLRGYSGLKFIATPFMQ
jgi:hypothetical protein